MDRSNGTCLAASGGLRDGLDPQTAEGPPPWPNPPARTPPAAQPAKPAWKTPTVREFGLWSGFEGREGLLGRGLVQIADVFYRHHLDVAG